MGLGKRPSTGIDVGERSRLEPMPGSKIDTVFNRVADGTAVAADRRTLLPEMIG